MSWIRRAWRYIVDRLLPGPKPLLGLRPPLQYREVSPVRIRVNKPNPACR